MNRRRVVPAHVQHRAFSPKWLCPYLYVVVARTCMSGRRCVCVCVCVFIPTWVNGGVPSPARPSALQARCSRCPSPWSILLFFSRRGRRLVFFSHNRHRTRRRVLFPRDNGTHHARRRFCAVVDIDIRSCSRNNRNHSDDLFFPPPDGGRETIAASGPCAIRRTRSLHIIKIYITTTSTRGPQRALLEKVPAADFYKTFPYRYK